MIAWLQADHRTRLAQLHVWAAVTVLQAVGMHSEHGMAAVEAAGAEAWMEAEVGRDPWGALPPAATSESDAASSSGAVGEADESPGDLKKEVEEEDFWKVEEQALKDLIENGTTRWTEADSPPPPMPPPSSEDPSSGPGGLPDVDMEDDPFSALLSAMGEGEKNEEESPSDGSPEEEEQEQEEETEEQRVAREELAEREQVAQAIDVWEEAALGAHLRRISKWHFVSF